MFHYKEIVSCSAAVLALSVVLSHARPNQNEMLVKSASSLSQDSPSKLPWSPASGGVVYLPEINAFLVPAESLAPRPQFYLPPPFTLPQPLPAAPPPRRRRPVANFIKYINSNYPSQDSTGNQNSPAAATKTGLKVEKYSDEKVKPDVDGFYGAGAAFYGALTPRLPLYSDLTPKITELDRTLSENDRLLEKITEGLDDTTMFLMGQGGQGGTRLTLRPVAKAVAGPRGVAVASPIAQAVLRRKDPAPEISYEPDSVAVAGPGGQAYSHPKLIITYVEDEPSDNSTQTLTTKEASPDLEKPADEEIKQETDEPQVSPNQS